MQPDATVNGKKVVIWFLIGAFLFTIVGVVGTYLVGQATTPYFKQREADREKQQRLEAEKSARAAEPAKIQ